MAQRYLIVGLGNPGPKYENTRHNIGFRCLDALAHANGLSFERKQGKALLAAGTIAGQQVVLAKPQTFMNLSGDAVSALMNFYKIPPQNMLVIFDDLDLPVGTLRIRASGGSGGQKGMKHIIQRIGSQDFNRIRFGIGRPPGRMDPAAYVLLPFHSGDESILVAETIDRALKAIVTWLTSGIDPAMNTYNGSPEDIARRQSIATQQAARPRPTPPATASSDSSDAPGREASSHEVPET